MDLFDFAKLIRDKKKTIFSIVFTVLILIIAVNFLLPKKYGSELQVIIIQNNLNNTDPYLVSKSSEHLGNILTKVIYSGSFYKKVINSGFGVDEIYFGKTSKDQLKNWAKTVGARNIEDTGIINISAIHSNREQAELIVESIGYNLKTFHTEYHGSGENVEIKIINDPITSNFPVKPNMPINFVAGLVFSLMFSFLYIYIFPDRKYDLSLLPVKNKREIKKISSVVLEKKPINEIRPKEEVGDYYNENEIYQDALKSDLIDEDDEEGGYIEEGEDDLEIDYEELKRKGNIKNIL